MKTGFENKRNVVTLAVLGVILLVAAGYFVDKVFVGGPAPTPVPHASTEEPQPAAENAGTASHSESTNGHAAKKAVSLATLDPTLHPELMAGAESLVYAGDGRNIFSMSSAPEKIEKVAGPVRNVPNMVAKGPTGPPPPPAIDLTFFGYESGGGTKKAFLLHGDDVFIASEGDVVDHHYKVVKISPLSIQVTDLLYNNTQTLPLSQS
ncbi:MAG: hypothetical protein WA414_20430 [Acidobacteriaceae bacterium]